MQRRPTQQITILASILVGLLAITSMAFANEHLRGVTLNEQRGTLEQQDRRPAADDEKIVATSGAVEATNERIANLDDYTVLDTVTVYFRNGRADISRDYATRLQQLAQTAKGVAGYSVQVEGHASAVGRDALNQRLSKDRAEVVAAALEQNGIPSTRMLVPAAMGTSDQVASNTTKDGQAQNRRTVVRLLQNRGISGN